jgi:hypothetical protein
MIEFSSCNHLNPSIGQSVVPLGRLGQISNRVPDLMIQALLVPVFLPPGHFGKSLSEKHYLGATGEDALSADSSESALSVEIHHQSTTRLYAYRRRSFST